MAESLSHKFGQIIGDLLEFTLDPIFQDFANKNSLFLDKKGARPARSGKKVTWTDGTGNKHDLDFVLERGGANDIIGSPVAFIESAWRRYTKHSRNKAQEIQGAIIPLSIKYKSSSPFVGVVLAGVFTDGALNQLKSNGFNVLYFKYETVVAAFLKFGINAEFDEKTEEGDFRLKIDSWEKLPNKFDVAKELIRLNQENVDIFIESLEKSVSRYVESVYVLPLYGSEQVSKTVTDAISFLYSYSETSPDLPILKYEIIIKYNTGERIDATFIDKVNTIKFLENYL
jgi:hypothetical protein